MITRELQQAANDLAEVEAALISLYLSAQGSFFVGTHTAIASIPVKRERQLAKPELPRCAASTPKGPCRNPADAPNDLCIHHFLGRYGHVYAGTYTFENWVGNYHCKLCGLSWRYPIAETPDQLRTPALLREGHDAIRTACPGKAALTGVRR